MLSAFQRRDEEKRFQKEGRLPPGQSLTHKFPVLQAGSIPTLTTDTWTLHIYGQVEQETTLTWEQFNDLPKTRVMLDLHCVTRWSKMDTLWEGVSLRTLVDEGILKLLPMAHFLMQHAAPDYTVNLPVEVALADNFLMATHYNGMPITPDHGYPVRGVIGAITGRKELKTPYLWKGAKWLTGLEFLARDKSGYWEQAGYNNEADVWLEQRYRE